MRAVLVLALLGACSNLDPITANVCGNGVVEAGEDCDSPGASCSECSVVCELDGSCGAYDSLGFVCGPDNLCHAATGELGEPVSTIATIETFAVTPLDDDLVGDVLVQTPTGVQALYGVGDGSFFVDTAQLSATPTGPAAFQDLDGDGRLDVILPTPDGVAAFTSPFGRPASQAFPAVIGAGLGTPIVGQAAGEDLGVFLGGDDAGRLVLVVYDGAASGLVSLGAICDAEARQLDASTVTSTRVAGRHIVLAMGLTNDDGTYEPCVVNIAPPPPSPSAPAFVQTRVDVPAASLESRPVLVAGTGSDGCPALVGQITNGEGALMVAAMPLSLGDVNRCVATADPSSVASPMRARALIGAVPLDSSRSALVFERQIYEYELKPEGTQAGGIEISIEPLYTSDRDLVAVQHGDLDRDGLVDVVARSVNGNLPVEDLDILTQLALADEKRGFLRLRYDTLGPVTHAAVGDYDGDQWLDVALVQTLTDGQTTADELAIAYSSAGGLGPQTSVGLFEEVRSLIGFGFLDSIDPFGRVSDLAVMYRSCAESEGSQCIRVAFQVSQLHGSPQRTLIGYYDPRPPAVAFKGPFGAVVLGKFVEADADPDELPDLIAFEHEMLCFTGQTSEPTQCQKIPTLRLWRNDGALDAAVGTTDFIVSDEPATFPYSIPGQFVALPRGDAELDLIVGANAFGQGLTVDPSGEGRFVRWDSGIDTEGKGPALKRAELIHVTEGDALVTKLLLVFAGSAVTAGRPTVRVCSLGAPFQPVCQELAYGQECTDAAVWKRSVPNARQVSQLVALCRNSAGVGELVAVDTASEPLAATVMPIASVTGQQVRTGDVTGDAIEDVLVLDRMEGFARIRVFPQCTTREPGCGGGMP